MGFEDIKVDGLSVEKLKKETEKYNNIYFGKMDFSIYQDVPKGQLIKYKEEKHKFLENEFSKVKNYFQSLGWDLTEKHHVYTFRANSDIYVVYRYDSEYDTCYIEFKNSSIHKTYDIQVKSDFKENPYYRLDNSKNWGAKRYTPKGGEATDPEMIKERLDEIKAVVEHNKSLNENYNFKLFVDKDANNQHRYESEIQWTKYDSVMGIINEISNEYF